MRYYIIIPAHNEAGFIRGALEAVMRQTLLPIRVVVVNDHSTDDTQTLLNELTATYPLLTTLTIASSSVHLPGSKVVNAFNRGLELLDEDYDFLVKLDADIILPDGYFEKIAAIFRNNKKAGIAGGFAYELNGNGEWKLNHPMHTDHVRGAFKSYSKDCFMAMGGLKTAMGWDTVDELLAGYHGFEVVTDESLQVRHLRPLGQAYNKKAKRMQGEAMYTMRYGFMITCIASLKMAWGQKKPRALGDNLSGYFQAKKQKMPYLVSEEEGNFIRNLRWKKIKSRLI